MTARQVISILAALAWVLSMTAASGCDEDGNGGSDGTCPQVSCDCPGNASEAGDRFCYGGDLYECVLSCPPGCDCSCERALIEHCDHRCGEGMPGEAVCCPELPCDCPDYATEMPNNYFCEGDDLYECTFACVEHCGCSCMSDVREHCAAGCTDPQDGTAHCSAVGGAGGAGGQGGA